MTNLTVVLVMPTNSNVNDVAPSSLNHISGQKSVVRQVRVALDACQIDGARFPHALLIGPPGQGKSCIAGLIALEQAVDCQDLSSGGIRTATDLNFVLMAATDKSVVHFDEAHQLSHFFQTILLVCIDKQQITVGRNAGVLNLPMANATFLFSTTSEELLIQPLRDRLRLQLRFEFLSDAELTKVVQSRARSLDWDIDETLLPQIAARGRGTPRTALNILEAAHRYCRSLGEVTIAQAHLDAACEMEQITSDGLNATDQSYMKTLIDGAKRINVIASMLGLPSRTLVSTTEPFLIRKNFLIKDDQSRRTLTSLGMLIARRL